MINPGPYIHILHYIITNIEEAEAKGKEYAEGFKDVAHKLMRQIRSQVSGKESHKHMQATIQQAWNWDRDRGAVNCLNLDFVASGQKYKEPEMSDAATKFLSTYWSGEDIEPNMRKHHGIPVEETP